MESYQNDDLVFQAVTIRNTIAKHGISENSVRLLMVLIRLIRQIWDTWRKYRDSSLGFVYLAGGTFILLHSRMEINIGSMAKSGRTGRELTLLWQERKDGVQNQELVLENAGTVAVRYNRAKHGLSRE